jgi:hypothetical protein
MITPRRFVIALTCSSLLASLGLSCFWFASVHGGARYEPAVNGLLVFAAVVGLFAEPLVSAQQERELTLRAVRAELLQNAKILTDQRFAGDRPGAAGPKVYPRLGISAVEHALVSGGLARLHDADLVNTLHAWRNDVNDFNRRLELTEQLAFAAVGSGGLPQQFEAALHRTDGLFEAITRELGDLRARLETY